MNLGKILPLVIIGLLVCIVLYQGSGDGNGSDAGPSGIPGYAMEVLDQVKQNGKAPKGYVGGRTFQNREKRLPKKDESGKTIKYKEWDVHPKVKGKNRGAERLVTGSDDNAYYTKDHYRTFKKIE